MSAVENMSQAVEVWVAVSVSDLAEGAVDTCALDGECLLLVFRCALISVCNKLHVVFWCGYWESLICMSQATEGCRECCEERHHFIDFVTLQESSKNLMRILRENH